MQLLPNNFTGGIHKKKNYLHTRAKKNWPIDNKWGFLFHLQTLVSAEKYYIFPVYHLLSIHVSLSSACFLSHREGNDLITRPLGLIQSYNKSCGSCVKWLHGWLHTKDIRSFDLNTDIFPKYVNCNVNNTKKLKIFVAIQFIYIFVFIYKSIFSQDLYFGQNLPDPTHFSYFILEF